MSEITIEELEKLKTYTDSLMNHVYWVQQTFDVVPTKSHIATCINFVDLNERKTEFCRELINTIPEWIYSKEKYKEVFEKLEIKRGKANASNELSTICFEKFRGRFKKGDTDKLFAQGQFGELLLFNFLQKFFFSRSSIAKNANYYRHRTRTKWSRCNSLCNFRYETKFIFSR